MFKNNNLKLRICFSVALSLFILYVFYRIGISVSAIIIFGIFFISVIFLKGPLYKKIDENIARKIPFFERLSPWGKKLLVIVIFLLIFSLLKQALFYSFKLAGVDLQGMITESVYRSGQ